MDKLKELLLSDELEQLKELKTKLEALRLESYDKEAILKKVTPLFDQILLKRLECEDDETIKIFSQYIAKIMQQASQDAPAELSKVLQSTISESISKEIANNKESMIDVLYPIIGGMISKYVTQAIKEMMETINVKIEDGLSFDKYKRKLKSKMTGVSETELLLEESSNATIFSLFVIQKESGLLIAEAHLKDKEIDDPHMVASMASAIKDFMNDWVQSNESQSEVQILSYGNATLYIESAGSVYIIAFLDAEPDYEQRSQINAFFASVVKKYAKFFQKFDGDDRSKEIQALSNKMNDYLNTQEILSKKKKEKSGKNPIKYLLFLLGFVLTGYMIYLINGWYMEYRLEQKINEQTGQEVRVSHMDGQIVLQGHVNSAKILYKIEDIIAKESKEPIQNNLLIPIEQIDKMLKEQEAESVLASHTLNDKLELLGTNFKNSINLLNKKVFSLQKELNNSQNNLNTIMKNTVQNIEILTKEKSDIQKIIEIKKEVAAKLNQAFLNDIHYKNKDSSLDFRKINLFPVGEVIYNEEAIVLLKVAFEKYVAILMKYKEYIESITIEGYTDSSGIYEDNLKLSQKRAASIMKYLLAQDIIKTYEIEALIHSEGFGSKKTVKSHGVEDKEASRRIKIKFKIKDTKILENIKKILND